MTDLMDSSNKHVPVLGSQDKQVKQQKKSNYFIVRLISASLMPTYVSVVIIWNMPFGPFWSLGLLFCLYIKSWLDGRLNKTFFTEPLTIHALENTNIFPAALFLVPLLLGFIFGFVYILRVIGEENSRYILILMVLSLWVYEFWKAYKEFKLHYKPHSLDT